MYDLILQNNSTKQTVLVSGLTNASSSPLYFYFEDFEMPSGLPYGEYTYFLVWNSRDDVEYAFKDVVLDSTLSTEDGDVLLRDLRPETGLLKYVGDEEETVAYRDTDRDYYYRKK